MTAELLALMDADAILLAKRDELLKVCGIWSDDATTRVAFGVLEGARTYIRRRMRAHVTGGVVEGLKPS